MGRARERAVPQPPSVVARSSPAKRPALLKRVRLPPLLRRPGIVQGAQEWSGSTLGAQHATKTFILKTDGEQKRERQKLNVSLPIFTTFPFLPFSASLFLYIYFPLSNSLLHFLFSSLHPAIPSSLTLLTLLWPSPPLFFLSTSLLAPLYMPLPLSLSLYFSSSHYHSVSLLLSKEKRKPSASAHIMMRK